MRTWNSTPSHVLAPSSKPKLKPRRRAVASGRRKCQARTDLPLSGGLAKIDGLFATPPATCVPTEPAPDAEPLSASSPRPALRTMNGRLARLFPAETDVPCDVKIVNA